uniref:Solute carrier family 25 member 17 n=1 Tax=Salmo trutta TaxID=8032 RepID=A0A673YKY7_SALTR
MSTREFRFAEVFSYESLVHAMAGAVGSVTAMTVFFPLDTARLRLQGKASYIFTSLCLNKTLKTQTLILTNLQNAFVQIIEDEGVGALWNGTFPSLLLVLNPAVQSLVHRELLSLEVFLIGAIAKAVATTVTYPLQTVQSILRFGQHTQHTDGSPLLNSLRSVMHLLINRVKKYGMLGLFKGLEAKLLQTVLTAALMFLLYEKIASSTFRVMGVKRPASSH